LHLVEFFQRIPIRPILRVEALIAGFAIFGAFLRFSGAVLRRTDGRFLELPAAIGADVFLYSHRSDGAPELDALNVGDLLRVSASPEAFDAYVVVHDITTTATVAAITISTRY
jgi:hypothetical protein